MHRVMVVDDEEMVRGIVARILRSNGYEVIEHDDAGPALADADLDAVELILTDLNMPTPGERLIAALRESGRSVPIVVMSGYLTAGRWEQLQRLGVQAALQKPMRMQALLEAVRTHTQADGAESVSAAG